MWHQITQMSSSAHIMQSWKKIVFIPEDKIPVARAFRWFASQPIFLIFFSKTPTPLTISRNCKVGAYPLFHLFVPNQWSLLLAAIFRIIGQSYITMTVFIKFFVVENVGVGYGIKGSLTDSWGLIKMSCPITMSHFLMKNAHFLCGSMLGALLPSKYKTFVGL